MLRTDSKEFTGVVRGKNFMTPLINGYYITGNYICELSHGDDFDHNLIYGVTVVNGETMKADHDKSQMFNSLKEAKAYMRELGKL